MNKFIKFINYNSNTVYTVLKGPKVNSTTTGVTHNSQSPHSIGLKLSVSSTSSVTAINNSNQKSSDKIKSEHYQLMDDKLTHNKLNGDFDFEIKLHDVIIKNKNIKFNLETTDKSKTDICLTNYYFNIDDYNNIKIGRIFDEKTFIECVKLKILSKEVIIDSIMYNLDDADMMICGKCSGNLYILITYHIIKLLILKNILKTNSIILYDCAIRYSNKNTNKLKLSVEHLIKYNRSYYEGFGFLPQIIYANDMNNISGEYGTYTVIKPNQPKFMEYFNEFVKKRKEFLNMSLTQIYILIENDGIKFKEFWTINSKIIIFMNINILRTILDNSKSLVKTQKLNELLLNYKDKDELNKLFYYDQNLSDYVLQNYTPITILTTIISLYKENGIKIYDRYFNIFR